MDACPAQVITTAATAAAITGPRNEVAQLTSRLKAGEEAAWREFHDAYCHRLLRYLLVVTQGDEDPARNALQSAFIRAVRHVRRFDSEPALWSWLTVLALSAVRDDHRKRRRYLAFLERWFDWLSIAPPPATPRAPDLQLQELLSEALAALPEPDVWLIESKYFEEQSVREIAAQLGSTEKAVESRLSRLRGRLKDQILSRLRHESEFES
jgi:RNA polymerase sigma factor (sigma-70 family)